MKKRTYCEKHVTAFVFIHQMLTAAYCYQKKRIEIHTYVVEFSNTHPHLLTATTCVFSHHKYFFAKLNKPAIYFLKFNPLWSYVSSIAHAMCRNDGFLLQPNKDRCLFQDILKWTFKTVLSSSILKNR